MMSGFLHLHILEESIHHFRGEMSDFSGFFYPFFEKKFLANTIDSDKAPDHAASDQSLYCLPMSTFVDTCHKWVKARL